MTVRGKWTTLRRCILRARADAGRFSSSRFAGLAWFVLLILLVALVGCGFSLWPLKEIPAITPCQTPTPEQRQDVPIRWEEASPFICGANMHSELRDNLSVAKQMGVTTIRLAPGPDYSRMLNAIKDAGLQPLIILNGCGNLDPAKRLATDRQLVMEAQQVFGANARVFYELGNENDLTCRSPTQPPGDALKSAEYTAMWNAIIPELKQIAPSAWFGGPTMSFPHASYIADFVHSAEPKPDFISWHVYPCKSGSPQADCIQNVSDWGTQIADVKKAIRANGDAIPPMMVTEWNYAPDEGVKGDDKHGDAAFLAEWTTTALKTLVDNDIYASYHFNVYVTPLLDSAQGEAFQSICQQITGSTTAVNPSPTSVNPPPSISSTPGPILAQDTFRRPNQTLWATASDGQAWGGDANTSPVFSIQGDTGRVANGNAAYNAVLGPVVGNAEVLFTGSMNSFQNSNIGAVLRWSDTNNWYKAYIDGYYLVVQKNLKGSLSSLGTAPFPAAPNSSYSLRFLAVDTTLAAKVWPADSPEPSNWMVRVVDGSFFAGRSGLRMQVQSGAAASYASFTVTGR